MNCQFEDTDPVASIQLLTQYKLSTTGGKGHKTEDDDSDDWDDDDDPDDVHAEDCFTNSLGLGDLACISASSH